MDILSTKVKVIEVAKRILGRNFERFLPAHPIAGSHEHGLGNIQGKVHRFHEEKMERK